mgnify:CR=1 FL=1
MVRGIVRSKRPIECRPDTPRAPINQCLGPSPIGEPGLPGVALGHNERIAWGITIIGADTADIIIEEINPAKASEYAAGERFEAFSAGMEPKGVNPLTLAPANWPEHHDGLGTIPYADPTWQAFWGTAVDGKPAAEVGAGLGMSPGAVYVAKSRVLARLRGEVRRMMEEETA